jgi:hypothetical protein
MNGCRFALTIVTLLLLLVACGEKPRFELPIAKTNPTPTQRYEITVKLIDPPADIRSIVGEARFGIPDVSCMYQPDPISGYTPGSSYIKEFALTRIDENLYRGHIFLDWPIDEDYFGLGRCNWKLHSAVIAIGFPGYTQKPLLWGNRDFPNASREWWCRRPETKRMVENCTSPFDSTAAQRESLDSYLVILSSTRK